MKPVVFVYSQPGCAPCKIVVRRLTENRIRHRVIDVSRDSLMRDYVVQHLGATSTPVIEAEGWGVIRGYRPDEIDKLIAEFKPAEPECSLYDADIHDYVYTEDE